MNREEHKYIRGGLTEEFINLFNNMKHKHCTRYWGRGYENEQYKEAVSTFHLKVCEHYHRATEEIMKGESIPEPAFASYLDMSLLDIRNNVGILTGNRCKSRSTDALSWRNEVDTRIGSEGEVFTEEEVLSNSYNDSFEGGAGVDAEVALATVKDVKLQYALIKMHLQGWEVGDFYSIYQHWIGLSRNNFYKKIRETNIVYKEKEVERKRQYYLKTKKRKNEWNNMESRGSGISK